MNSAHLLLYLIVFETAFATLFSLYTSTACSMGLTLETIAAPSLSGIEGTLAGVLVGIANIIVFIINGFISFGRLFTGIGMTCGFPSWYIPIFQIPILLTIIYLCIPFVKGG